MFSIFLRIRDHGIDDGKQLVFNVSLMCSTHCIDEYTDLVYLINRFAYIITYEHLLLNTLYYIRIPCLSIQTYHIMS